MPASASLAPPPAARERILEAALACFARSGFHGASMQAICAEAGMSPGALYRYFRSKEAIIAAIAEGERERHAAFFERLAEAEDPVETLASIGIDLLEAALHGPFGALGAEIMAEAIRNPDIRRVIERNQAEARASLVATLARGQARGVIDPSLDVDAACRLMLALADGLCAHQALDPDFSPARLRPALRALLRRFFRPEAR